MQGAIQQRQEIKDVRDQVALMVDYAPIEGEGYVVYELQRILDSAILLPSPVNQFPPTDSPVMQKLFGDSFCIMQSSSNFRQSGNQPIVRLVNNSIKDLSNPYAEIVMTNKVLGRLLLSTNSQTNKFVPRCVVCAIGDFGFGQSFNEYSKALYEAVKEHIGAVDEIVIKSNGDTMGQGNTWGSASTLAQFQASLSLYIESR